MHFIYYFDRDEGYTSRIKVVRGDLAKPKFALSDEDHTEIINNISDIYHSGAWVNMSIPYPFLFCIVFFLLSASYFFYLRDILG